MSDRFISEPRDFTLTRPGHTLWSFGQAIARVRGALDALDGARAKARAERHVFDETYYRELLNKAYGDLEREARKLADFGDAVLYGSKAEAEKARAAAARIEGLQDLFDIPSPSKARG